jgi:hypothetical protein
MTYGLRLQRMPRHGAPMSTARLRCLSLTLRDGASRRAGSACAAGGLGSPVHLPFDHLDAAGVAFDGAGAPGEGETGGDGGPVLAQADGEAADFRNVAGLGLAGPAGEPGAERADRGELGQRAMMASRAARCSSVSLRGGGPTSTCRVVRAENLVRGSGQLG